jgi:radical SAM superfamily enzyme YgiQ (UPF0313 family)
LDREESLKKDILLINPPIYFYNGHPESLDCSVPPLGLMYLASYINKYSVEFHANVIDIAAENISLRQVVSHVESAMPFAVGITSMTPQLQGCVELASAIKNSWVKPPIFLGGPHVSADSGFIMRHNKLFDYAIAGEAEKTFFASLERLRTGFPVPSLQKSEIILDLDSIPIPVRQPGKYQGRDSVIFSRGCPYDCYYCSRPAIDNKIRYRSAENMIAELKQCSNKIDFQDDTLTLNKSRVIELCQDIIKENMTLDWRCNTRIDLVDEEILTYMKHAGCTMIHFGIEAGNEHIRKEVVRKGNFTNNEVYNAIGLCKKIGIETAGYFILGHPSETKATLNDTKQLIFKSGIDILGLSLPTPFPGSKLFQLSGMGTQNIDQFAFKLMGEGYAGIYPILFSGNFTKAYLFKYMQDINRKFYLNYKTLWRRLVKDINSFTRLKKDFLDLISIICNGISRRKPYVKKT